MSRLIDKDFEKLRLHLTDYSLDHIVENQTTLQFSKQGHKLYLTALQLWAVFVDTSINTTPVFFQKKISTNSPTYSHFKESISDIGSSFFCCLNGTYKPSYMALRSSIENFLRFTLGEFENTALTTTKIYELFEIANKSKNFSALHKDQFNTLHEIYKILCAYSHSASLEHMTGLHGLAHFPKFSQKDFKAWISYARKVITCYLVLVLSTTSNLYTSAHFTAKEIFDLALPRTIRLSLLGA